MIQSPTYTCGHDDDFINIPCSWLTTNVDLCSRSRFRHGLLVPCKDPCVEQKAEGPMIAKKARSCLKRPAHTSSTYTLQRGNQKSVSFDLNKSTNSVHCSIQTFRQEHDVPREELWWSKNELQKLHLQEMVRVTKFQGLYRKLLKRACKSVKSRLRDCAEYQRASTLQDERESIQLCFWTFSKCQELRGLEHVVYPNIKALVRQHRRAVLSAQKVSRRVDWICSHSQEWSHSNRLLYTKMGEYDHLLAQSRWSEQSSPISTTKYDPLNVHNLRSHLLRNDSVPVVVHRTISPQKRENRNR